MGKAKKRTYLIINNKEENTRFYSLEKFDENKIKKSVKEQEDDLYIDIRNGDIDKIIKFAMDNKYNIINYGETYILNQCFQDTGYATYGKNIAHEAINKFVADDKGRYFFLCDNGKISTKRILDKIYINCSTDKNFCVENSKLISYSKYETDGDSNRNKYVFIQKVDKLEIVDDETEKKVTYNRKKIRDIFKPNSYSKSSKMNMQLTNSTEDAFPCITFKGETIKEPKDIQQTIFNLDELELGKSTMRQYVFEGTKLYKALNEKIKANDWQEEVPYKLKQLYEEEDSILSIIGRQKREPYFSSLFRYMFSEAPRILKGFLGVEEFGDYKIYNEAQQVDILIVEQNNIIIIENKIDADINEGEKKNWDESIPKTEKEQKIIDKVNTEHPVNGNNQLQKYYNLALYYKELSKELYGKNKEIKAYILCPEYNVEHYKKAKEKFDIDNVYQVMSYNELSKLIIDKNLKGTSTYKREIIKDIKRAMAPYIEKQNVYYMRKICSRFSNATKKGFCKLFNK